MGLSKKIITGVFVSALALSVSGCAHFKKNYELSKQWAVYDTCCMFGYEFITWKNVKTGECDVVSFVDDDQFLDIVGRPNGSSVNPWRYEAFLKKECERSFEYRDIKVVLE